jgi:RimJ/RimL family protein N-acetyltransferase
VPAEPTQPGALNTSVAAGISASAADQHSANAPDAGEPGAVDLRQLGPADAPAYRDLMLAAYAEPGDAFTSSVAERRALPLDWWQQRLRDDSSGAQWVLGVFAPSAGLVGTAGLSRETREKLRHKASLFGMVVAPAWRGRGLGRRLVMAVLDQARRQAGLRVVQLTVSDGNAQASRLYEHCGFSCFGVEPLAVQAAAAAGGYVAKRHLWIDLAALAER